jgi:hypothetical protein
MKETGLTDAENAAACNDRMMAITSTETHRFLVTVQVHRFRSGLLRHDGRSLFRGCSCRTMRGREGSSVRNKIRENTRNSYLVRGSFVELPL